MENPAATSPSAWRWIPTLYFAQGVPNAVATSLAAVMFKNLGVSNADLAFYLSWLYLPWVCKPLWAPLVDLHGTKRTWIVALQFVLGVLLATVALTVPAPDFARYALVLLWLTAFSSATHDIAADGFYLLALPVHQQAAFVGVRSTFFRVSTIVVKGGLVWLAGRLFGITGSLTSAWSTIFLVLGGLFGLAALYHLRALPRPAADGPAALPTGNAPGALAVFASFFAKPGIAVSVFFLLVFRLPEALALRLVEAFLLDPRSAGGLALNNEQVGLVNGTVGTVALLGGGLLGGWLISRHGLKRLLWPMLLVMHLPVAVFVFLAAIQPSNLYLIGAGLAVEQFGYGFGFTAYMVYMMLVARGPHQTAHYAICTGFMALGLMLPGMKAGVLQEHLGYPSFFGWALAAGVLSLAAAALVKIDPAFGRKV